MLSRLMREDTIPVAGARFHAIYKLCAYMIAAGQRPGDLAREQAIAFSPAGGAASGRRDANIA